MKKKLCFIINPISGVGRQKTTEKLIEQHIDEALFDCEIIYTDAPKHAILLAQEAVKNNFSVVAAVGGDGSINEVANGLVGSKTSMAIIPTGSGNGLSRHLNIPLDLRKAMELINKGTTKTIDTVKLNGELFLNVAGIGFDAHIGWEFSKYKKRGFLSYVKLVLRELPSYKDKEFELSIDGQIITTKAFLIAFANGSQWGNNAYISPHSIIDDGMFEVAILKNVTPVNFLSLAYKLFNKQLDRSSHLEIIKTKEVMVKQLNNTAHIDGEAVESGNPITIKINPLSLNIIVP